MKVEEASGSHGHSCHIVSLSVADQGARPSQSSLSWVINLSVPWTCIDLAHGSTKEIVERKPIKLGKGLSWAGLDNG